MKRSEIFLSYFVPVTIESAGSRFNPVLDVVLSAGKLSLNSRNSNYSYGSLQMLFEKAFRKLDIGWSSVEDVLILGFGAGGVAEIINGYCSGCTIDGVEIDEKVIELGKKYFHTELLQNVNLHCRSAEDYFSGCGKKYDLVVIDVYNDMDVPEGIERKEFLVEVKEHLRGGGTVIFNKFVHDRQSGSRIDALRNLYSEVFGNVEIRSLMLTAKIFIARNNS